MSAHLILPSESETVAWGHEAADTSAPFLVCHMNQVPAKMTWGDLLKKINNHSLRTDKDLVVVFFRSRMRIEDLQDCTGCLKTLLQTAPWRIWIHSGHNQRPAPEKWKEFFGSRPDWSEFAFFAQPPERCEWYSLGASGASAVHDFITQVREAVRKAIKGSVPLTRKTFLDPLEEAAKASLKEQEGAEALGLVEELFPHYLKDPFGRTVPRGLFDRLHAWCASQDSDGRDRRGFSQRFEWLSKSVSRSFRGAPPPRRNSTVR